MDIDDVITVRAAAALKGVCRQSIYTAILAGKIRVAAELDGKKLLVRTDVEAYAPYRYAGPRRMKAEPS